MELALADSPSVAGSVWTRYLLNRHGPQGALRAIAAAFEPLAPEPGGTNLVSRSAVEGAKLREKYVIDLTNVRLVERI